jgi:site-specific recombinase
VMQLVGFTLDTKQPSMTAAALAAALRSSDATRRVTELVGLIARLTRSQLAAAMGNVGMVVPTCMAFDYVWFLRTQQHFLDVKTAEYVVQSLHPLESPVIWFATLTGVYLWLSSLAAGWLENWAVYRRLPEAIEQHRLGNLFGRKFMLRLANGFRHQIAGFGGSMTLGTLLGVMPMLGKGFGLPIGAAHVTLSAGALTFAGCALGLDTVLTRHYAGSVIGIACIGLLNFGVSFVLALWVALRARSMVNREKLHLVRELLGRFLRKPWEFFFPPKAEKDSETIH